MNIHFLRLSREAKAWGVSRPGICVGIVLTGFCLGAASDLWGQQDRRPAKGSTRCVIVEVYVQGDEVLGREVAEQVEQLRATRGGLVIARRDISASAENRARFDRVVGHYRDASRTTPLVYVCNRVISGLERKEEFAVQLEAALRLEVFVRTGCPRCASAKAFLPNFVKHYPGLELVYRDVAADASSLTEMQRLIRLHRTQAASVPVFHLCNRLIVGFTSESLTRQRLDGALQLWTIPCPAPTTNQSRRDGGLRTGQSDDRRSVAWAAAARRSAAALAVWIGSGGPPLLSAQIQSEPPPIDGSPEVGPRTESPPEAEPFALPLPPEPLPPEPLPVDEEGLPAAVYEPPGVPGPPSGEPELESLDLPIFGRLDLRRLSLPAVTLAIGLVDGFNPCAMWVLLFLLSLLVNLKDRVRIVAIAGTFIFVSGLAYFAFMAAWLNVFLFVGYLRPIQIGLGVLALVVGSVHIKDFFAFHRGISLSIPEAAKPGIYARTRRIVLAENLVGAMIAATVLAFLVNVVELLCTAGLPALYTEILTMRQLPAWQNYAYLLLYNAAYMFDDTLMVGLVVITLSKRKLQEHEGRWLKLISGATIASLGAIMILKPQWLL